MTFLFIADYFKEEYSGGAENCDDVLINKLRENHTVYTLKSKDVNGHYLDYKNPDKVIVSNFAEMSEAAKNSLIKDKQYIIYEHDHKYLQHRNPSVYPDCLAPTSDIVNFPLYEGAQRVIVQSSVQKETFEKNLGLENIISCNGNLWSDYEFSVLEKYKTQTKHDRHLVLYDTNPNKGFWQSLRFCLDNHIKYDILYPCKYEKFIATISNFYGLVFLPNVQETFSRVSAEARCLGLTVLYNENVPFFKDYGNLSGNELINQLKENQENIIKLFEN